VTLFDYADQCETVSVMVIKNEGPQPKSVIRVFAACAVEFLIDDILAEAVLAEETGDVCQDICAAANLVGFAAMNADQRSASEIIGSDFAEHLQHFFHLIPHWL